MNRRIGFLLITLLSAGLITATGAFSSAGNQGERRAIHKPDANPQAPFSNAIQVGNTLYLSGDIGLDPKTGMAPASVDEEIKLLLDSVKATLTQSGFKMDDLVTVTVYCSDLSLYDKFNAAYKSYFTTKDFPARAFIGAGSLLRAGHFELQAIAVKH
jgi:2-iminobutanoate/2-iminopropanoate deaminase